MKVTEIILETQYESPEAFRAAMMSKSKATFSKLSNSQKAVLETLIIGIWKSIKSKNASIVDDEDAVFACLDPKVLEKITGKDEAIKLLSSLSDSRKQLAKGLAKRLAGIVS